MATHRRSAYRVVYRAGVFICAAALWIALAATLAGAATQRKPRTDPCINVLPSPLLTQAYGAVTLNGAAAPVNTLVEARSPRGDTVGCFVVSTLGLYGSMPIYGEDMNVTPTIPGMRPGEITRFFVNGCAATASPDLIWANDPTPLVIALAAQCIPVSNLILAGPITGTTNGTNIFTAIVDPLTATLPITYVWQATGQLPMTYTGDISDTRVFTWSAQGIKAVAVTANNTNGAASASQPITITYVPAITCYAQVASNPATIYNTVQDAVDAANNGDTVKVAGYCSNVVARNDVMQVAYISKTLTLRGGYTTTNWTTSYPVTQPTTLDAQGLGRVIYLSAASSTIEALRITGGNANGLAGGRWGYDAGGGVYVNGGTPVISACAVYSNTSVEGGGVYLLSSSGTLLRNTITGNTAIPNSVASAGGGIFLDLSSALLDSNVIQGNVADTAGGIELWFTGSPRLNANIVRGNLARKYGAAMVMDSTTASFTNSVVVDNRASGTNNAAGIHIHNGNSRFVHTTIAHNTGGDGDGIDAEGTATFINTILVSHTTGISVTAGKTVTLTATLWGSGASANQTDKVGPGTVVTGTINVHADPSFVNPSAGDYHIQAASGALDVGINAGVTTDADGNARPLGFGFDIGAYELAVGLRVSTRSAPNPATAGNALTYTIQITNVGGIALHALVTEFLPSHVTPTGILIWTPTIPAANIWTQRVVVTVGLPYTGTLTHNVQVTTQEGATGSATDVTNVIEPPGPFAKSSPASGVMTGLSVTFTWGSSLVAASYEYCLDQTNDNLCGTGWQNVGNGTSVMVTNLLTDVTYYWQVHALNADGVTEADGGAWWNFTAKAPPVPQIYLSPTSTAHVMNDIFTMDIKADTDGSTADTIDAYINFDPSVLEVVDAAGNPATSIDPNTNVFSGAVINQVNNANGTIDFSAARYSNPLSGTFTAATIRFHTRTVVTTTSVLPVRVTGRNSNLWLAGETLNPVLHGSTVNVTPGFRMIARVEVERRGPPGTSAWVTPLYRVSSTGSVTGGLRLYPTGSVTPAGIYSATTDVNGFFTVTMTDLNAALYDVQVKGANTLANERFGLSLPATSTLDFGTLLVGDSNGDNAVNVGDVSYMIPSFTLCTGSQAYRTYGDTNRDGCVNGTDVSSLIPNWTLTGPIMIANPMGPLVQTPLTVTNALLVLSPPTTTVSVGATFTETIMVNTGITVADTVDAYIDFDPTKLQVVNASGLPATQIDLNMDAFPGATYNTVDNAGGHIGVSASIYSQPWLSGQFAVATIRFKVKSSTPSTAVSFVRVGGRYSDVLHFGLSLNPQISGMIVLPTIYKIFMPVVRR